MRELDPNLAYKPNSGHFGDQVSPEARTMRFDEKTGEWMLCLGGPGNPVIRSKDKLAIEGLLSRLGLMDQKRGR